MPKSIYFTDDRYEQIVAAARAAGFRVQRGCGSQLAQFVVWAANNASTGLAMGSGKSAESNRDPGPAKSADTQASR